MRVKAIFFSPMISGSVTTSMGALLILLFERHISDEWLLAILLFSILLLLFQVFIIEPCLFLISYFKKIDLKTYYYFAISCCYFLSTLIVDITSSKSSVFEEIKNFVTIFSFCFFYSLVNIYFYNLFYFKHKHEDLQTEKS